MTAPGVTCLADSLSFSAWADLAPRISATEAGPETAPNGTASRRKVLKKVRGKTHSEGNGRLQKSPYLERTAPSRTSGSAPDARRVPGPASAISSASDGGSDGGSEDPVDLSK